MLRKSYIELLTTFIGLLVFFLILTSFNQQSDLKSPHDLEILFYSNLNGNIENCNCGEPPLGGLNYIATIVDSKRKEDTPVIFIDGGDFSNPYPFAKVNNALLEIYKLIRPDILVLGDQEFIEGKNYTDQLLKIFGHNILSSSYRINSGNVCSLYDVSIRKGIKLQALSFVDEIVFKKMPKENLPKIEESIFKNQYQKLKKSALKILIYHGSLERVWDFFQRYPNFDLILLSHDQRDGVVLQKEPTIIGGGADGEYLVNIQVTKQNKQYHFEVNKIPVSRELTSNKKVDEIISQYKQQMNHD